MPPAPLLSVGARVSPYAVSPAAETSAPCPEEGLLFPRCQITPRTSSLNSRGTCSHTLHSTDGETEDLTEEAAAPGHTAGGGHVQPCVHTLCVRERAPRFRTAATQTSWTCMSRRL